MRLTFSDLYNLYVLLMSCRGVFAKNYKTIRESLKKVVVELLFDPFQLKLYFTGRQKTLREIFQLGEVVGEVRFQATLLIDTGGEKPRSYDC